VYTQVSKSQSTLDLQPLNVILTLCFAEGRISGFHRSLKMFHSEESYITPAGTQATT
jgi:hypothetical protein